MTKRSQSSPLAEIRFRWRDSTILWWAWLWRYLLVSFIFLFTGGMISLGFLGEASDMPDMLYGILIAISLVPSIYLAAHWAFREKAHKILQAQGQFAWITAGRTLVACWICLWRFCVIWFLLIFLVALAVDYLPNKNEMVLFIMLPGSVLLASWTAALLGLPKALQMFAKPFWESVQYQQDQLPGQSRIRGIFYIILGSILVIVGIAVILAYLFFAEGRVSVAQVGILGSTLMIPGALLFHLGRRHLVRVGHPVKDKRKPILFLRSFEQDGMQAYVPPGNLRGALAATKTGGRYEDMIRYGFREMGPLLAIGEPGENLPETGAARVYFPRTDKKQWKQKINGLLSNCQLVLLQVGASPGLAWEVEQSVAMLASTPTRLVLCVPTLRPRLINIIFKKRWERDRREIYKTFRKLHGSKFPKGLPEEIGYEQFICFGEDWIPRPPLLDGKPLPGKSGRQVTESLVWLTSCLSR